MNSKFDWFEENWKDYWSEGTVFVEGDDHEFLMLDDLRIVKYDGDTLYSVIEQHGDDDPLATKDVIFDLTASGILELLREALTSSCPLSTLYFKNKRSGGDPQKGVIGGDLPGLNSSGMEENAYTQNGHSRKVYAKAYISPKTKRILCINAGAQFADLLFSFFTLPVGAIIKLLSKSSLIGCLDTLYRSIEELGTEHFKAETLHLLLQPKLHAHFGLKHSRLPIEERSARKETFIFGERRLTCCSFGLGPRKPIEVTEIDPKLGGLSGENQSGGGFANMDEKFLITEDLRIEIFSAKSMVDPLKKYQLRVSEVVRKKIWVDEITALHFLKACLVYPDPLAILPLADPSEREEPEGSGDDGEGDVDPSQKDFRDAGDKTRSDAKKKEAAPFLCSPFNRLDPMAFRRLAYEPEGVGLQTICSGRMDPGQCSNTAPK